MIYIAIVILGCFTYIGYNLTLYNKKRVLIFEDLVVFCNLLASNICFNQSIISNIISGQISALKSPIKNALKIYLSMLENNEEIDFNTLSRRIKCNYLEKRELWQFINFLCCIGKFSVQPQVDLINGYKASFECFLADASGVCKKNGGVYSKLGLLLGLAVVIILI